MKGPPFSCLTVMKRFLASSIEHAVRFSVAMVLILYGASLYRDSLFRVSFPEATPYILALYAASGVVVYCGRCCCQGEDEDEEDDDDNDDEDVDEKEEDEKEEKSVLGKRRRTDSSSDGGDFKISDPDPPRVFSQNPVEEEEEEEEEEQKNDKTKKKNEIAKKEKKAGFKATVIAVDGMDGVGKTEAVRRVKQFFDVLGPICQDEGSDKLFKVNIILGKEPGLPSLPLTMELRKLMLDQQYQDQMTPVARELISQAARSVAYERWFLPAVCNTTYDQPTVILCDRSLLSGLAYGVACGHKLNDLLWLAKMVVPDQFYDQYSWSPVMFNLYNEIMLLEVDPSNDAEMQEIHNRLHPAAAVSSFSSAPSSSFSSTLNSRCDFSKLPDPETLTLEELNSYSFYLHDLYKARGGLLQEYHTLMPAIQKRVDLLREQQRKADEREEQQQDGNHEETSKGVRKAEFAAGDAIEARGVEFQKKVGFLLPDLADIHFAAVLTRIKVLGKSRNRVAAEIIFELLLHFPDGWKFGSLGYSPSEKQKSIDNICAELEAQTLLRRGGVEPLEKQERIVS